VLVVQFLVFLERYDDRSFAVGHPHVEVDVRDCADGVAHVSDSAEDSAAGDFVLGVYPVDDPPVFVALCLVELILMAQMAFREENELEAEGITKRAELFGHFPAVELLAFFVAVENSVDLAVDSAESSGAVFEAFPHRVVLLVG
jgi:hypothetical protein